MSDTTTVFNIGSVCFGVVIGWVTYRTLARKEGGAAISDLAAVIGAVGGGVVLGIFDRGDSFGWYAIGLAVGFFGYLGLTWLVGGEDAAGKIMGD
jgi:hypothetical protein